MTLTNEEVEILNYIQIHESVNMMILRERFCEMEYGDFQRAIKALICEGKIERKNGVVRWL